jgi:hypothetical protein
MKPIRLFSAWDGPPTDPTNVDKIRDVMFYCASRLRAALIVIINIPEDAAAQSWLQRCLLMELVSIQSSSCLLPNSSFTMSTAIYFVIHRHGDCYCTIHGYPHHHTRSGM